MVAIDEPSFSLRLRTATVESRAGGSVVVTPFGELSWAASAPGVHAALLRLAGDGGSEPELVALVREHGSADELAPLFYQLRVLETAGALVRTLMADGKPLLTVVPLVGGQRIAYRGALDGAVALSRFAYLRADADDGALVLESPKTHARVRIDDRRVTALVHALVERGRAGVDELAGLELLAPAMVHAVVGTLLATGHLIDAADDSEQQPPLATWSFHDLLFHARSRLGRNDTPNGKTYPFRGKLEPLPAIEPIEPSEADAVIELPRPDLDALAANETSFTGVLESRESIRVHGDAPIRLAQLAEFLYRAARVRRWAALDPAVGYEFTTRPSPGGGACHELELYLAINRCDGLDSGLYHYDPLAHRLTRICGRTVELERLLADTVVATGGSEVAQVLICIAARFARMAWPYEGIAYAATLKNVGALIQTMYLVATAMGLAPCALGRGDADLFASVAGTNYYAQTTVGEFILGSRVDPT